jgi:hypothetical protein
VPSPTTTTISAPTRTIPAPNLRTQVAPVESHFTPAPALLPTPDHIETEPAAQLPTQPRQLTSPTVVALGMPTPLEPVQRLTRKEPAQRPTPMEPAQRPTPKEPSRWPTPVEPARFPTSVAPTLAEPATPVILSQKMPSEPAKAADHQTPSRSVRPQSAEPQSAREFAEKKGLVTPDVRRSPTKPLHIPIPLEPPVPEQVPSAAQLTSAAGSKIHIGSLEIKITPPPSQPPPSQAPLPVRKAPAVPAKSLSREFATFGIAQGY